jgi:sorbitol-specific phosphotransferase system component IIBC
MKFLVFPRYSLVDIIMAMAVGSLVTQGLNSLVIIVYGLWLLMFVFQSFRRR